MSQSHISDDDFTRLFVAMLIGLVVLTVVLIGLAVITASDVTSRVAAQKQQDAERYLTARVAPMATVAVGEAPAPMETVVAAANADDISGEAVYTQACGACHTAGVAGAPRTGDVEGWAVRLEQGMDVLYRHAIDGFQGEAGFMPAKGGQAQLSDEQVEAAVDWMVAESQ